ncbi:MAG: YceI family protein [Pseudomonadota bacterium]
MTTHEMRSPNGVAVRYRAGSALSRMAILGLLVLCACAWRVASADTWRVDQERSRVGFVASYDSIEFPGTFRQWQAAIAFDPSAPEQGRLEVDVDMASVDTKSQDRDAGIRSEEWFDTASFGAARYRSLGIRPLGDGRFAVDAEFEIKGRKYPLSSEFTWRAAGTGARLSGQVSVDRRTFAVGTGEWADEPIIGFRVLIEYDLYLTR